MKKTILLFCFFLNIAFGFAQDKLKLQANIANRNGDLLFVKDKMNKTIQEMKADKNGQFATSFDTKPGFYILYDGVEYTDIYLKNGFDLQLSMDAKNFDESIVWAGIGADENNFLAKSILLDSQDEAKMANVNESNFQSFVNDKKNSELERLNNKKLDPNFVELKKKNLDMMLKQFEMEFKQKMVVGKLKNAPSPTFDYENYDGGKTKLESLKGKYVYIDIWATWCGPCRAEIPSLKKVEEKFRGKNIEFVSISIDEDKDHGKWKTFVNEKGLSGTQLFADKNWMSAFIRAFNINSIPRFILIDPKGNVLNPDADRPSNPALTAQLEQLLN